MERALCAADESSACQIGDSEPDLAEVLLSILPVVRASPKYSRSFLAPARCSPRGRSHLWSTPLKLSDQQQSEIRNMISKGDKAAAGAARLMRSNPQP